jgi:ATP adenylyltransferase/5',5'''-P-1,P-4-tetraphosphate phosphorylase II
MNKKRQAGDLFIENQLAKWQTARTNHEALNQIETRRFELAGNTITVQFNPARAVSTCAKVDKSSIEARKCFLCPENKPNEQDEIIISLDEPFSLRINPYPILPGHLTISSLKHQDQVLADKTIRQLPGKLISWLEEYFASGYVLFYNGAKCGASAPDHFHFQAVKQSDVPVKQTIEGVAAVKINQPAVVNLSLKQAALSDGESVSVSKVNLGTGYYYFSAEVSGVKAPLKIEVRIGAADGKLLGTLLVKKDGYVDTSLIDANGKQTIYLKAVGGDVRISACRFFAGNVE